MPWFIFEANIAHFKERLERESDPQSIAVLSKLLAEEEARLSRLPQASSPTESNRVKPPQLVLESVRLPIR